MARLGHVDGILVEDHRIVVGERHAPAAVGRRGLGDLIRQGEVGQGSSLPRLADIPVLAEATRQVAARGAEGEHGRTGEEVVQRLLLDRIDAEPAGTPIGRQDHGAVQAGAHETHPALSFLQLAGAGAEVALDPSILEAVPVPGGNDGALRQVLQYGRGHERLPAGRPVNMRVEGRRKGEESLNLPVRAEGVMGQSLRGRAPARNDWPPCTISDDSSPGP